MARCARFSRSLWLVGGVGLWSCYGGRQNGAGAGTRADTTGTLDGGADVADDGGPGGDDGSPNTASAGPSGEGPSDDPAGGDPDGDPADGDPTRPETSGPDPSTGEGSTRADPTDDDGDDGDDDPPPIEDGCPGYATRYWDCCKAHCGWDGNVPDAVTPLSSCNQANVSQGGNYGAPSSCTNPGAEASHTCYDLSPWAVNDDLAYGFSAVPANGDICGRCYQLEFLGTSHEGANDPGSQALQGKTMIVQAINIGFDVGGGQFDVLIPGGGVGAFNACSAQWGAADGELGPDYGGVLLQCKQEQNFNGTLASYKACVAEACAALFDGGKGDLAAGCQWFIDWFEVADNPNLVYQEVQCPAAIIEVSGMDRGPLDDIQGC
jgi:hypothetical protein